MIENILVLSFLAALCSCDVTAFGQFMISRPIFCGPVFGFLTGDINCGIWIGMIVEMIWVNSIPLGVAVPIDVSVVTILSTVWTCNYFIGKQEAAICALILAVPMSCLHREIDIFGRNANIKIMYWIEKGIEKNQQWRINVGIAAGILFFLLRSFVFYLAAIYVGGKVYAGVYLQIPAVGLSAFSKAWFLLPIAGFGAVIYNFKNTLIAFSNSKKQ
ncbi:MAG: PTS sugar transporter subunit IIC [Elusimicrobiota bacterium]|jgi:mannose/fructose/N-acetylgalactosamine-specific phosphotransferase system component IIC|nr:PTS sugar transporter subunit IIC [Elusimicrobiota bacterium]